MSDIAQPQDSIELMQARAETMRRATEIAVRLGVLTIFVALCLQILAPFVGIVAWGLIIAIAVTGPYEVVVQKMGDRRGLTATLFVLLALALVIIPAVMLSETLVSGAQYFAHDIADGSLDIPPPPAHIADWPIIGGPLFKFWSETSQNLQAALAKLGPQLLAVSKWLLQAAGSVGAGLIQIILSMVLASIMLMRGENRSKATSQLASRLAGAEQGPALAELATATISSVVQGIVGVALIQAVLAGIGFIVAGVPGAGLWALLVLVSAIVQIPVVLVLIPPILLVVSASSTTVAIVFGIWCVAVSLLDNFLKPILFGRGVAVPTIVIFLGAIGGMIAMGIIGLFVGAVILAVGYELFSAWVQGGEVATVDEVEA
jgi:predicted PurR-regulated permease PerM